MSKAAARNQRKSAKPRNNEPLLRLAREAQDPPKRPIKARAAAVKPLNKKQALYDVAIASKTLVFGMGPAGTGKTWFAAARAAEAYMAGRIERIIITRPAVEAGESLGFLPGELDEKFEPYLRPVRDALNEVLGSSMVEYLLKTGDIEARPLGLIRGSTLKNCIVLFDEAQNATKTQMKMLLTRIGENCTVIVNGDPDQCDLPNPSTSGLVDAQRRLEGYGWVGSVEFTDDDIVRSGPCQDVVRAYSSKPRRPEPVNAETRREDLAGLLRTLGVQTIVAA